MNTGRIYKSKLNKGFTVIPNEFLQTPYFSAKAKGLLCYILSLPDDWKLYKSELTSHFSDGKDSLMSGFKELENAGYIKAIEVRNEKVISKDTIMKYLQHHIKNRNRKTRLRETRFR